MRKNAAERYIMYRSAAQESEFNMIFQFRSSFALHLAAECGCTAAFHLVQDKVDFRSGLFRHAGGAAALEAEILRLDRIALIHPHADQLFNVAFISEIHKCRGGRPCPPLSAAAEK